MKGTIKFIDLFAGIGGIRCGLELAAHEAGYKTECVFTSEIKKHAIKVLKQNHPNELINKLMKKKFQILTFVVQVFHANLFPAAEKDWALQKHVVLCFLMLKEF